MGSSEDRTDRRTHVPKYRHFKPKDLALVRLDGRDDYLGRYGSTASRQKYHRPLAAWMVGSALESASGPVAAGLSVAEPMVAYLRSADSYPMKDGKPTREPENIGTALRPLRKLYSLTPAADFGPRALKFVRQP